MYIIAVPLPFSVSNGTCTPLVQVRSCYKGEGGYCRQSCADERCAMCVGCVRAEVGSPSIPTGSASKCLFKKDSASDTLEAVWCIFCCFVFKFTLHRHKEKEWKKCMGEKWLRVCTCGSQRSRDDRGGQVMREGVVQWPGAGWLLAHKAKRQSLPAWVPIWGPSGAQGTGTHTWKRHTHTHTHTHTHAGRVEVPHCLKRKGKAGCVSSEPASPANWLSEWYVCIRGFLHTAILTLFVSYVIWT